jgi:hypothetical protein
MCQNSVQWVFELEEDYSWESGFTFADDFAFKDKIGIVRLILFRNGKITVTKGYAWDGCSPKFCIFDILIGTPDGVVDSRTRKPKTYYASLVHDALYQFLPDGVPLIRKQADGCFLKLMTETGFAPRHIYHVAVRIFGGLFTHVGRRIRKSKGIRIPLRELDLSKH